MPVRKRDEAGYSLVEFPVFLAAMLIFLTLFAEMGTYAFTALAADNASYAAARALSQDVTMTEDEIADAVVAASPALSDDDVEITASVSDASLAPYVHHVPAGGAFEDRESFAASRDVSVTVEVSWQPKSWLGRGIIAASGEDAMSVSATHGATADATIEGGVSQW